MFVIGITGWKRKRALLIRCLLLALLLLVMIQAVYFSLVATEAEPLRDMPPQLAGAPQPEGALAAEAHWRELLLRLNE